MRETRGNRDAAPYAAVPNAAGWALALLALAGIGLRFVDAAELSAVPLCPLHALTGLHCPGCGATRALHALVRGDVALALRMNALFVGALPALALASLVRVDPARSARGWIAGAVLAAAFGVARNLPLEPFARLAPPATESGARG